MRSLSTSLMAAVALGSGSARASDGPTNLPSAYEAWAAPGSYGPPEDLPPRPAPPPPLLSSPEYPRRPVELLAGFGIGLPHCAGDAVTGSHCTALGSGLNGDASLLYRATPYFAFGALFGLSRFGMEEGVGSGLLDGDSGSLFLAVLGRVYFLEEGSFDPYLELGLGGGELRTSGRELPRRALYEQTGTGPAARIGAGFDVYVWHSLRAGPALDWTTYLIEEVRRCGVNEPCSSIQTDRTQYFNGFVSVGVRLSVAFGQPL